MRTFLAIFVCVAVICEMVAASKLRGMSRLTAKKRMAKREFSLSFGPSSCSDAIDNCASYGQSVCSDSQYTQWVQDNCCAYCSGGGGSVPSTTSGFQLIFATEAPPLPASSGGSCADAIDNCADYTTDVCSNAQYSEWVATNCPKYCGTCSGSAASLTNSGSCRDNVPNCDAYTRSVCSDSSYSSWVQQNCAKYCGVCGSTSTGGMTGGSTGGMASFCMDKIDCSAYAPDICTNPQYTSWATENCAKKCNMCGSTSGGTMTGGSQTGGTMTGGSHTGGTMTGGTQTGGTMTGGTHTGGTMTGTCQDAIPNCADYTSAVCSDQSFGDWVTTNCPKFCHKCSATPTMGGGGSSTTCTDTIANCADYGTDVCTNPDYTSWVASNCQKYCNQCPSSSSSSSGGSPSIPSTGGSSGTSSGCVYNGNVYQQGQTWKDNCQFACECTDGSTGKYTCTEMCLHWNLPSECSMNPPAPGKCCETPNCPAGFTINYPDGYVEQ